MEQFRSDHVWGSNDGCMDREGVWVGNAKGVIMSLLPWGD